MRWSAIRMMPLVERAKRVYQDGRVSFEMAEGFTREGEA